MAAEPATEDAPDAGLDVRIAAEVSKSQLYRNFPDKKALIRAVIGKRATQVGLTVHSVDPERNLLLVKGAVPGPKNGLLEIREMS